MNYIFKPAISEKVPLLIGLIGPTWTGKTFSALRLATGIVKVRGGRIAAIDTEARRMLQYAHDFSFQHCDFGEPFSSLNYAEAITAAAKAADGGCVIVDSMSHEHEGLGGYLDFHDQEVQRLMQVGGFQSEMSANIPAWNKPSGARRKLINTVLQLNCAFVFCFRAKEKIKPVKGAAPRELGWQAIAGEEFGFEMTARCLLTPGCQGVPDWTEDAQKLGVPKRIHDHEPILKNGRQLDESCGVDLAKWAAGIQTSGVGMPKPTWRDGKMPDGSPLQILPEAAGFEPSNQSADRLADYQWKILHSESVTEATATYNAIADDANLEWVDKQELLKQAREKIGTFGRKK